MMFLMYVYTLFAIMLVSILKSMLIKNIGLRFMFYCFFFTWFRYYHNTEFIE